MNVPQIILVLISIVAFSVVAKADSADETVVFYNAPVSLVIEICEKIRGEKIATPSEISGMKTKMSSKIQKKSKKEALKILEDALAEQAGVEIVRRQNGTLVAQKIAEKK